MGGCFIGQIAASLDRRSSIVQTELRYWAGAIMPYKVASVRVELGLDPSYADQLGNGSAVRAGECGLGPKGQGRDMRAQNAE